MPDHGNKKAAGRPKYDIERAAGITWRKKKSYRYLYRLACREDVIRAAFFKMKRKKGDRKDIREAEAHLDESVERIRQAIVNTKPDGWKVERPDLAFYPPAHEPVTVRERGKERTIYVPSMEELWIQHVVVMILEPIIRGSSYEHSYSSFPGRGGLAGKRALQRWIRSGKGVRNFAQFDIRHFYGHVKLARVMEKLGKRVRDGFFLHLVERCMARFPDQLPLGFYLSQWLANFLLQDLDHGLKGGLGIAHAVRYMDNVTLADDSKKRLHAAVAWAGRHLARLGLKLKGDWQVFRFEYVRRDGSATGRAATAMGWVFHRDRTCVRERTLLRLSRVARRLGRRRAEGRPWSVGDCRALASLMGWVGHSDAYGWYLERVKPHVSYRDAKRVISKADRKEARNGRMEEGAKLRAA